MTRSGSDVIVVGGGVIGVCTAYYLAKRGVTVTLLERDEVGKGASFGNAGCIAPGHGPLNKPGRVKQAIKSLGDPLSPLYVAPRPDPALGRWLWEFAHHCNEEAVERAMEVLGPLGHRSLTLFDELLNEERLDCDYRREGYYDIFLTDRALAATQREAAVMERHGFPVERLSGDELRAREPSVRENVIGAVHYTLAGSVDPYRFVSEVAQRAAKRGVRIVSGATVGRIATRSGRANGVVTADGAAWGADVIVLAAGAWSGHLAKQLGIRLPLQPAKGYHRDRVPGQGAPHLSITCMLGERSVFCTPMSGRVRFAGTLEFSGLNLRMRRPRLEQLTNAARQYVTGMDEVESRSEWCGLRPCLADGLPAVGASGRYGGLYLATGHAMLGLTLGPATGELVAALVTKTDTGSAASALPALGPDRFQG